MKIISLFILLGFISACSLDTKSGIWDNNKVLDEELTLSLDDLNKNLTFDQFKKIVIEYGKKSKYPDFN